jgi:hypothetical protein
MANVMACGSIIMKMVNLCPNAHMPMENDVVYWKVIITMVNFLTKAHMSMEKSMACGKNTAKMAK